jgi:molecular chaperone HtpG
MSGAAVSPPPAPEPANVTTNAEAPSEPSETHTFQADVARLLHLMVHSIYSDRDIFVRELLSNAADACEKLRYEALSRPELLGDDPSFLITIEAHAEAGSLAIRDNGIGMNRQELVDALGTIANSGTRAFLERIRPTGSKGDEEREIEGGGESDARLIGQFGIGFYSAFMVAERVEVFSRKAGEDEGWVWSSDGAGSFAVAEAAPGSAPARGVKVVLHLKSDAREYLDAWRLEEIVREHSGGISVPVDLRSGPDADTKRVGDGKAIWTRAKSEISADEYRDLYRNLARQFDEPALTIHWRAEGRYEYTALAFVPGSPPLDLFDPGRKGKGRLYVRRVLISDESEILPSWLRFVRILVDSADLPLNVSREMIQKTPMFGAIRKAVVNRIVQELVRVSENDAATFAMVWKNFGAVLKEGLYEDPERRDALFKLTRFTTTTGENRSLADYVRDLRPNQTEIYYLVGEEAARIASSPQLEGFRARGVEVLLLSDPVDAFWVEAAIGFEGKPFRSVTRGDANLSIIPVREGEASPSNEPPSAEVATLLAFIKQTLGDEVADVKASSRLSESVACLVAGDQGPDLRLRRLLAAHGKLPDAPRGVLEVNPQHRLVRALAKRLAAEPEKSLAEDVAWLIYDEARLLEGEAPVDASRFAARLSRVLEAALG